MDGCLGLVAGLLSVPPPLGSAAERVDWPTAQGVRPWSALTDDALAGRGTAAR
jgi:hypothetical protein